MDTIQYVQAQQAAPKGKDAFIKAFQEVFAGPPYFDTYESDFVGNSLWLPHLERGIIILAYDGADLAGFGCAIPLLDPYAAEPRSIMADHGYTELERIWYMSDLGVLEKYRYRGIGRALVLERLERLIDRGASHYCLQTESEGSHSEHLYRKVGATEVCYDAENSSRYFMGSCQEGISRLTQS